MVIKLNFSFVKKEIFAENISLSLWITDFKQNIYLQLFVLDCLKTITNIIQVYLNEKKI